MDLPEDPGVADDDGRQWKPVEGQEAEEVVKPLVPRGRERGEGHALLETRELGMRLHAKDDRLEEVRNQNKQKCTDNQK